MIDRVTVDRIMSAVRIVDVVSDFVTLRKSGANYKGLCPFHDDRTPSFVVSPAKGLCKCFACGKGGNAVRFIMEHEQLSYSDALRYLARKYNIEIRERELTEEEKQAQDERESMFVVNEWACGFFQDQLFGTEDGRAVGMAYLHSRGFRDDMIRKFRLGYCPRNRDACVREAKAKGYREEFLVSTGLCLRRDDGRLYDRFSGRVIFPVLTLGGKVVAFGGRVLDAATKGVSFKYQNSPESVIYSKKKELYGLFLAKQAIVRQDLCFLVEGYTDVISMHQMGVENVVSSSGTALTTEQIRLIHRFTENITVLYDGDAAGIKASERGIDMLLAEGMNVRLLLLPDGDDPDSFARKHNATEYQDYLKGHQVDFIKYKTDLLLHEAQGDPIRLSRLVSSIVHTISVIPDEITRSVYVRETAAMLGMEERVLVAAVSKEIAKAMEERQKRRENERNRNGVPPSVQLSPPPGRDGVPDAPSGAGASSPEGDAPSGVPIPVPVPPSGDGTGAGGAGAVPYVSGKEAEAMLFHRKELLLVQVLVRYGEKFMFNAENERGEEVPVRVAEYIDYALKEDGLQFRDALHKHILQEAIDHIHEEGFSSERYFLNHPDDDVSMLAFELSGDKYQLSKFHSKYHKVVDNEDRLKELVSHLVSDFKLAVVTEELKKILSELHNPDILLHREKYMEIMKRYKEMKDVECALARGRGDRVLS